jgi:hypothetical protein
MHDENYAGSTPIEELWFEKAIVLMQTRSALQRAQDEAHELYENPIVADSYEERIADAIYYFKERNWTMNKASSKAGVSWRALDRYKRLL